MTITTAFGNTADLDFRVADLGLAPFGRKEIQLAEHEMPGLMSVRAEYADAQRISSALVPRFEAGEFESGVLIYWRFLSAGAQQAVVRRFLPLEVEEQGGDAAPAAPADLEYEPNPTTILNELLPRYVEGRIFSALLDASASEHAARQRAMKSATDNAEDLKISLTRVMNRARQDAITTEIMEIVGGAEALASGHGNPAALLPDLLGTEHLFPQHLDPTDHRPAHH